MESKKEELKEVEKIILNIFRDEKKRLCPGSLVLHFNNNCMVSKYELHTYPHREKKLTVDFEK